jgi:hypothetical protein
MRRFEPHAIESSDEGGHRADTGMSTSIPTSTVAFTAVEQESRHDRTHPPPAATHAAYSSLPSVVTWHVHSAHLEPGIDACRPQSPAQWRGLPHTSTPTQSTDGLAPSGCKWVRKKGLPVFEGAEIFRDIAGLVTIEEALQVVVHRFRKSMAH